MIFIFLFSFSAFVFRSSVDFIVPSNREMCEAITSATYEQLYIVWSAINSVYTALFSVIIINDTFAFNSRELCNNPDKTSVFYIYFAFSQRHQTTDSIDKRKLNEIKRCRLWLSRWIEENMWRPHFCLSCNMLHVTMLYDTSYMSLHIPAIHEWNHLSVKQCFGAPPKLFILTLVWQWDCCQRCEENFRPFTINVSWWALEALFSIRCHNITIILMHWASLRRKVYWKTIWNS